MPYNRKVRVRILSGIQIAFPVPGEFELNVLAEILPGQDIAGCGRFAAVVVSDWVKELPICIKSEVEVVVSMNHYRGNTTNGRPMVNRLCLKTFPPNPASG
jgi:hypothetical protein